MKITKAIDTPEGKIQFQGELNEAEVTFMTEWFLNSMMARGALPFVSVTEDNQAKFAFNEEHKTQQ